MLVPYCFGWSSFHTSPAASRAVSRLDADFPRLTDKFDPLNLGNTDAKLDRYTQVEIKHGGSETARDGLRPRVASLLLGAPGIATRSKNATRNKGLVSRPGAPSGVLAASSDALCS